MSKNTTNTGAKDLNIVYISNLPTGGFIGVNTATVDNHQVFYIIQTTAGQTLSLPTPTTMSVYNKYYIKNAGSVSFTMYGKTVLPNGQIDVTFDGSSFSVTTPNGLTLSTVSSAITAVTDTDYAVNTVISPFTVTLPSAPANGSRINLRDAFGSFATNNLTISRGGTDTIDGLSVVVLNISNQVVMFTYNATNARWTMEAETSVSNTPNSPYSTSLPIAIPNLTTGGLIGTAIATINQSSHFVVTQTKPGQTITLPSPTITASRFVLIQSSVSSTTPFTIYGTTILPGASKNFAFDGATWSSVNQTLLQTVDTVFAKLTAQTTVLGVSDVIFNQVASGNIPLNTTTGVFTLTAGKTYELDAHVYALNVIGGVNDFVFEWVDATTNIALVSNSYGAGGVLTDDALYRRNYSPTASAIYTPTTNQTVKLRVTLFSIGGCNFGANSRAIIKQIGSSPLSSTIRPTVLCRGMASAQSFPNGAVSTVITNWNKTLDTMNSFNQITGIFTAPISGQYQVHATHTLLVSTGQSAGTMDEIQLGVNATPQYQDSRFYTKDVASASAFESLAQINTIVQLNAGETLYFSRRHTYSAAFNGTTQASTNTLAISYINPNF